MEILIRPIENYKQKYLSMLLRVIMVSTYHNRVCCMCHCVLCLDPCLLQIGRLLQSSLLVVYCDKNAI